jgi:hypothetical protein
MTETPDQPTDEGTEQEAELTDAQRMDDQERARNEGLEPIDRDNPEEPTPPKEPGDEDAEPKGPGVADEDDEDDEDDDSE